MRKSSEFAFYENDARNRPLIHSEGIDNRASNAHYDFLIEIFPAGGWLMQELLKRIWSDDQGQDIAEYAVMLAVILVLVVGTIRLVGSNANNAFSSVASSIN
jgi:Flp pilus assembly pilin Flp